MRNILLTLLFVSSLSAQFVNVTVTLPDASGSEWGLSTTYEATSFPNIIAWIEATAPNAAFPNVSGIPQNTTLAAAITGTGSHANCTTLSVTGASTNAICDTITLTSTTNLAQCNGLLIGTEMMEVFSVSSPNVVVVRGTVGTTRATASNGTAVTVTRTGGGTCLSKAILADAINSIVLNKRADSTTSAANSTVQTNNTTITTTAATAIQ